MARARKKSKKLEAEHTMLGIKVDRYDARVEAALHMDARGEHPYYNRPNDLVFPTHTTLDIYGNIAYPDERVGELFRLTVIGETSSDPPLILKNVQVRDEHNIPQYRTIRGTTYPVYDSPQGLTALERMREARGWRAWIFSAPHFVTELLVLLPSNSQLYLSVQEKKADRKRWVQSVSLQTTDPASE